MKKIALLLGLLLSINTYAARDSAPIPLGGVEVKPRQNGVIDLKKIIYPHAEYIIRCDILNPNYKKQYPIILKFTTPGNIELAASLNGKKILHNHGILNLPINKYEISISTDKYAGIDFINLDDSDTATVTNCLAYYAID